MDVFIGNLPPDIRPNELREIFEKFGQVLEVRLIKGRTSGRFKRYGFVEMATQEQAQKAIEQMNGTELKDMTLTVGEAKPKKPRKRKKKKKQKRKKQSGKNKKRRRIYGGEDRYGPNSNPRLRRRPRK
jgi:RNA recognition motif-containing protein